MNTKVDMSSERTILHKKIKWGIKVSSYLTSLFSRAAVEGSISLLGVYQCQREKDPSDSTAGMQNIITSLHKKKI